MGEIACNGEISFHEQEVVSVFHETNVADRDEHFAELSFAGAFAVRQMSNMGVNQATDMIAQQLMLLSKLVAEAPTELVDSKPKLVPYPGNPGRKRFIAEFRIGPQGMRMQFKAKGFGILARGMGYYGPAAVQTLFRYFASRRADDSAYLTAIGRTAETCGQFQLERQIQVGNHAHLQLMIMGMCLSEYVPESFG